ncbi:MAG TPA: TIGR00730 family Rossman fold protein [Rhizomicrobium sp.]
MDKKTPAICVFCGSSHGARPAYAAAAARLGTLIGEGGYAMVFGGGQNGLMGVAARAAHAAGAKVLGVLPDFLRRIEVPLEPESEDLVIVPDMQIRKQIMLNRSDAFVVLPGGLGTLDELFEVLSISQLKAHDKPIVVIDTEGFYTALWPLLSHIVREGFAVRSIENLYHVVATPDEAMARIAALLRHAAR